MIRILHLSDFHYISKFHADFCDIADKIAHAIEEIDIDFVVFSGDMVYSTNHIGDLEKAVSCLIDPIKQVKKLSNDV